MVEGRLRQAAGADVWGKSAVQKLYAAVAQSTFGSQHLKTSQVMEMRGFDRQMDGTGR